MLADTTSAPLVRMSVSPPVEVAAAVNVDDRAGNSAGTNDANAGAAGEKADLVGEVASVSNSEVVDHASLTRHNRGVGCRHQA